MANVFVALGSNLQNPVKQVQQAFQALRELPNCTLLRTSSLYQTAPSGYAAHEIDQIPDFINTVAELTTSLTPEAMLAAILSVEDAAGRIRPYPNAPRVLDCDLLLYDNVIMDTPFLTLPHPRMHTRGFVLLPLFEIAPSLTMPNHGKIATLITPSLTSGIKKLPINQYEVTK